MGFPSNILQYRNEELEKLKLDKGRKFGHFDAHAQYDVVV